MKRLGIAAVFLFASTAFAQSQGKQHNGSMDISFVKGGFHFGASYEYIYNSSQGLGGQFQYFPKKSGDKGVMVVGALTGFHFYKGDWDFVLAPSFNIINIDVDTTTPGDQTTMGPGLTVGLTTALNSTVGIGFAFQNYYVWFGDDHYKGYILSDLAFRVKVGF